MESILTKYCKDCNTEKLLTLFSKRGINRYRNKCIKCQTKYIREWKKANPNKATNKGIYLESKMLSHAKRRANKLHLEFNLTLQYIKDIWPKDNICPITLEPFKCGDKYACKTSPTLDRIDNTKGYTIGNVAVISFQANACKQDITNVDLFKRLVAYMQGELMDHRVVHQFD